MAAAGTADPDRIPGSVPSQYVDWKKFCGSVLCSSNWSNVRMYRNKLNTAIWPGSLLNMTAIVGGTVFIRLSHMTVLQPIRSRQIAFEEWIPILNGTQKMIFSCTLNGLVFFIGLTIFRRMALKILLAYRKWMFEPPGKPSKTTTAWAILVKILSGWSMNTYSYQSSLPRMSVPPLHETLEKLMASLEPIFEGQPEKLAELKEEAKKFEEDVGPKLQRALVLRSLWVDNFVSDWWENYVYLMNRSPLVINSNYYIMDQCYWIPTSLQSARAAGALFQLLLVREKLLREDFEPTVIRGCIPTCMSQYKRIFSTTRTPGQEMDKLIHYPASHSQHVVVSRQGLLYRVDITDAGGQLLLPSQLEQQMEWIMNDADSRYSFVPECERLVPALTSQDRTSWAKTREEFFSLGVNKETLQHLESAILFIVLDTNSFSDLSTRAAHLLHGKVGSFWFDKSVQLISMSDGHIGLNCEHSYADAPAVGHIFEHIVTFEVTRDMYGLDGHCRDPCPISSFELRNKPKPLAWEVDDRLEALITRACTQAKTNIDDLDLVVYDHRDFGKGAIKPCRLSPDAFIQMALNTTYRKLTGTPVLTYEASMTRLFKHGRTETVRSLTSEANQFVQAFLNPCRSDDEKKSLLRAACTKHALLYKDAMNGKGIDRHLFALYVASRGLNLDGEFLKKVLSIPWTLSTSQQPQQQITWSPNCGDPKYENMLSPGGGFGPVAEDGYGVSYMVPGDHRLFFHVSSRRSGRGSTSSHMFIDTLKGVMVDMITLHGQKC